MSGQQHYEPRRPTVRAAEHRGDAAAILAWVMAASHDPSVTGDCVDDDMDADTDEVTTILQESPADGFSVWLNHDLRETIRTQALTPALARRLTGLRFATQDDVDQWLNRLWSAWFPNESLPGGRA